MSEQPFLVPCDGSATSAPVPATGRPNTALSSPQAGIVSLGSDYGTTPKAQVAKIDATGSQFSVATTPAGTSALYTAGQAAGAPAAQYGSVVVARQDSPSPSTFYPLAMDMQMALNVHHKSKVTFRALAVGVTCSNGKSLLTLINNSTMVLRVNECCVWVPPGGNNAALLGQGSATYYPIICELRRISSASGGTSITPISADTADVLASGVTTATGATPGATVNTFHRMDAVISTGTGIPYYGRGDQNEKTFVVRPGEGFTITCVSTGTINGASGGTTTAAVDVELTFTQAVA